MIPRGDVRPPYTLNGSQNHPLHRGLRELNFAGTYFRFFCQKTAKINSREIFYFVKSAKELNVAPPDGILRYFV